MKQYLIFRIVVRIFSITGIVLQACSAISGINPSQTPIATFAPSEIPTSTMMEEACGYVWAYQDLPDLSRIIQKMLEPYQEEVKARAQAFGEDCVYSNGESEFHALETDFYVTLEVQDLTDENELGDWIAKIMPELENVPPALLMGPKQGFCEFRFVEKDKQVVVRVPIEKFRSQTNGLDGAELYRLFADKPQ